MPSILLSLHFSQGGKSICRNVLYDGARQNLAPTQHYADKGKSFVEDSSGLFQAGDMMAMTSPGVEGAILSASECAEGVVNYLRRKEGVEEQLNYVKEQQKEGRDFYEPTYLKVRCSKSTIQRARLSSCVAPLLQTSKRF